MAIPGVEQPDILEITPELRLRKYDGGFDFALPWYQDVEMVYLVDGKRHTYTLETLAAMYSYLNDMGELYFIEILSEGGFIPIGDVTFWQDDMPIVIGVADYRGRGIGTRVVQALVERGKALGYKTVSVNEIYDFNKGSIRCFERAGFCAYEKTEMGARYCLKIQ